MTYLAQDLSRIIGTLYKSHEIVDSASNVLDSLTELFQEAMHMATSFEVRRRQAELVKLSIISLPPNHTYVPNLR